MGEDKESQHVSVETGSEQKKLPKENKKMNKSVGVNEAPIKFGSQTTQEKTINDEAKTVQLRKDAVEDWPAPKQIHSFYIVRYRRFEEPKVKSKIDLGEKELQKMNQARSQMVEKLRPLRAERSKLMEQIKAVSSENEGFWKVIKEKQKEMEPLHDALGKLRGPRNSSGLCSSEAELDDVIKSLQKRIQHESIPLHEEKKILKEIKRLEGTRGEVRNQMAMRAQIQDSIGEKETIQKQVKLMSGNLDEVRKDQQLVKAKRKEISDQLDANTNKIKLLDEEVKAITKQRDQVYANIREFRRQRDEGNAPFYQFSTMLQKAKLLADKKDVEALKEFSLSEVDKFISQWSGSKEVRDDYEKRILASLDIRQLSRDGRMRNPDEKPLVLPEAQTEIVEKTSTKPLKEESAPPTQKEKKEKNKDASSRVTESPKKEYIFHIEEEIRGIEKESKDMDPKKKKADEAKLRELKKAEEIAKNKQAMERKKKLAEKAAAKAAIKAQKEAEKKLKKAAKKKGGASVPGQETTEEQTETAAEAIDGVKVEEKVETEVAPKVGDPKEKTMKNRPKRAKGMDIPKTILKRKKAMNYWLWAAPAAIVVPVLLVAYNHLY